MTTIQFASTVASTIGEGSLRLAPARMLAFLQGVSDPHIRPKLTSLGWSSEIRDEALSLLTDLEAIDTTPPAPVVSQPATEAMEYCESWQSTGLIRSRAMLQLSHPEQATFLFHDFIPAKGLGAVLNAATFLDRRHLLGKEKAAPNEEVHRRNLAALAVLERTGSTKAEMKHLEFMIDLARTVPHPVPEVSADVERRRLQILRKIYAWVTAWTEMARTAVTRRDQLIELGIAKRRAPKANATAAPRAGSDGPQRRAA